MLYFVLTNTLAFLKNTIINSMIEVTNKQFFLILVDLLIIVQWKSSYCCSYYHHHLLMFLSYTVVFGGFSLLSLLLELFDFKLERKDGKINFVRNVYIYWIKQDIHWNMLLFFCCYHFFLCWHSNSCYCCSGFTKYYYVFLV